MKSPPLVSAIIIFLNGETYLEEAVESIFAQTCENWELLLVDDGSTDGSSAIAKAYAQQYPDKVRYLEHENHQNRGMSATRNLGVANARGEFIAFLDADDIWQPLKLERQLEAFDTCPRAGMVVNPTKYWHSWTGNPADAQRDSLREIGVPPDTCYEPPQLLTGLLLNQVNAPATCGVLIRKSVIVEVGGFENSFRGLFEDRAFFAKVYLQTPVFAIGDCLDWYRQHPSSACHVEEKSGTYRPTKRSPVHYKFLQWLESYLAQQNVRDKSVTRALAISFLPYKNIFLHYAYQIWRRLPLSGTA